MKIRKNSIKNTRINGAGQKNSHDHTQRDQGPPDSSDDFCDSCGGGTGS